MPRGGARPGAGRPRGSSKATKEERSAVKTLNRAARDPERAQAKPTQRFTNALDFVMDTLNDPAADMDAKVRLAVAALPFQHAKVESAAPGKKEQREQAAQVAAGGKFAPPTPPKLVVRND